MPISSHELKSFLNTYFVECGSAGLGWGISSALIAGFQEVYSIDINPAAYEECLNIFKKNPQVHLSLGDCGEWLDKTLNEIDMPCTVYLDANGWKEEKASPLEISLDALMRQHRKDHIILIDDINHSEAPMENVVHYLRENNNSFSLIFDKLRKVNNDYTFYLIDTQLEDMSHTFPSWVLIADPINNRSLTIRHSEHI